MEDIFLYNNVSWILFYIIHYTLFLVSVTFPFLMMLMYVNDDVRDHDSAYCLFSQQEIYTLMNTLHFKI